MYEYSALIIRTVDGDTVHAEVDFGCDTYRRMILRLYGINAPELHATGGQEAKAFLTNLVDGKQVILRTLKDRQEKFGRYLAVLLLPNGAVVTNVNDTMVEAGHAVKYMATAPDRHAPYQRGK